MNKSDDDFVLTEDFLRKYDVPGPRYTSYPPAPFFRDDLAEEVVLGLFPDSNLQGRRELSFYVHVPFCPKQCLFCGCTTEIGRPGSEVVAYFGALAGEMEQVLPHLDADRPVTQVHFGGGTPNGVPLRFLREILDRLRSRFRFEPWAEVAIECDPNLLTLGKLSELRETGFNRISFGLQDFDRGVLQRVGREFPRIPPSELIAEARSLGFTGINLDLIYGLPGQSPEGFERTVAQAIEAGPDRFATFSYAHVPWAKEHQKILETRGLPEAEAKLRMAVSTWRAFRAAGYSDIGMDHFAHPDDELAIAQARGDLHRNFQGYCSRRTTGQVVAFGASAISQLHTGYVQNLKTVAEYVAAVSQGRPRFERAYVMERTDRFRRDVINAIMCAGRLDLERVGEPEGYSGEEVRRELGAGLELIRPFLDDGLATFDGRVLAATPAGRLAVRNLAMAFDPMLGSGEGRYSRTV